MASAKKEGSGRKTTQYQTDDWHLFYTSLPEGYEQLPKTEVLKHIATHFHWRGGAGIIDKPSEINEGLLKEYECDLVGLVNNVDSKPTFPVVSVASERLIDWAEKNEEQERLWDLPAMVFDHFFKDW